MNYLRFSFLIFLFSVFRFSSLFAQKLDSIQKLDEVIVSCTRFKNFNTGHFYTTIDSSTKAIQASAYLGDILSHSSLFNINSYGAGAVSVSARGMGEKRTPVVWNGFNIQNIMSTGTDLGQLPSFFFEDVQTQMGGSSALFGSGAAGGILFLNNKQDFSQDVKGQFLTQYGSFGNYYEAGELSASDGNFSCSLKAYYNKAQNNFPYKAVYSGTTIDTTQVNAQSEQYGLMMNNFYRFSATSGINLNLWYTNGNKNVAPTLSDVAFKSVADGTQKDEFLAASAEYNTQFGIANIYVRSGFFNSRLYYVKPSWSQVSENKANWSVNEIETAINFLKYLRFNGGVNFTYEMAESNSFIVTNERYREALFSSLQFHLSKLAITVSGRQEIVEGDAIPFTYSTGIEFSPVKILSLKGNIAKNYRLPSFNDLYYKDYYSVGNPNLKPEAGMNYELGFELKNNNAESSIGFGANYFSSQMENWINWAQIPDTTTWSVFNIDKADISGVETFFQAGIANKTSALTGKIMYSYMEAKDKNTGKHIANVPQNRMSVNLTARIYSTTVLFQLSDIAERYSTISNKTIIPGYSISNLILSQNFKLHTTIFSVDLGVYNLTDKNYMVMNDYPMPKRNFRAGLRILF